MCTELSGPSVPLSVGWRLDLPVSCLTTWHFGRALHGICRLCSSPGLSGVLSRPDGGDAHVARLWWSDTTSFSLQQVGANNGSYFWGL